VLRVEPDLGKLAARLTRRALDPLQRVKEKQQATIIDCPAYQAIAEEVFSKHNRQIRESDGRIPKSLGGIGKSDGQIRKFDGRIRKFDGRIRKVAWESSKTMLVRRQLCCPE
jgi:hypothetical protein